MNETACLWVCMHVAAPAPHRCTRRRLQRPALLSLPCPRQLFTWSGASASVAFEGAGTVAVTFDGRMASLPKEHELTRAVKKDSTFPWAFFQVRQWW